MLRKTLTILAVSTMMVGVAACEDDLLTAQPEPSETVFENPEPTIELEDEIGFGERNNENVDIVENGITEDIPTEGEAGYLYLVLESSTTYALTQEGLIERVYTDGVETLTVYTLPTRNGLTVYRLTDGNSLMEVEPETSTLEYLKKTLIESENKDCVTRLNYSEFVVSVNSEETGEVVATYTVNVREGTITDVFVQMFNSAGDMEASNHVNLQYGFTNEDVADFPTVEN